MSLYTRDNSHRLNSLLGSFRTKKKKKKDFSILNLKINTEESKQKPNDLKGQAIKSHYAFKEELIFLRDKSRQHPA